jgi:type III secretion protein V
MTFSQTSGRLDGLLQALARRNDLLLAATIVAVVSLMVFPLSPFALDSLIAVNLAASVALLMLALYIPSALGLSTFPSLLLLTTLFRLALNIASTKQILLHADAGQIIDTFGKLVVGGNVIVGGVVFSIIAIVQFIVIAKGSERVAEVGARFTLDAMPGKQMSIDADLRAGNVTAAEARQRRALLEQESQLHGAMDGAMKFVKGDAIAAMLIALINILAGIAIGTLMHDMSASEALSRYTILTVGDGMVSQIPSLLVSVAAGILITRVSSTDEASDLGQQIGRQVMAQPQALLITGALLLGFIIVPGFPKIQFSLLALLIGGVGYVLVRRRRALSTYETTPMPAMMRDGSSATPHLVEELDAPVTVPVLIKIAPNLRNVLAAALLDDELRSLRRQLRLELGIPFPGVRMVYDAALAEDAYAILVQEIPVAHGSLADAQRVVNPAQLEAAPPPHAQGGALITATRQRGSPEARLAQHLDHTLRIHAASFVGMQEVQNLIKDSERDLPELASELLRIVPLQRVTDVLRRLVQEGISIRNLREIFESLVVWAPKEKDPVLLTEYVRIDLGKYITHKYAAGRASPLSVIMLDQSVESAIRESIQQTVSGNFLALPPEQARSLTEKIRALLGNSAEPLPLLLTSMDIRRYVKKFLEPTLPLLPVLSYQEIGGNALIRPIERVQL